jgi:ankyrin repeat protein
MKQIIRFVIYLFVSIGFSLAHADSYVDFFRAVNIDDSRSVNQLLARGFDPNSANTRGQPAVVQAVRDESPKVLDALLAQPSLKVDATTPANETALMMAALDGKLEWAKKLAAKGAAINRAGWTPLHYAASGPEPLVLAWLLDQGADINAASPNRTTPLMMAARYGNEDGATLLLARGADARLRNDLGLSAADFARTGGREALADKLGKLAQ